MSKNIPSFNDSPSGEEDGQVLRSKTALLKDLDSDTESLQEQSDIDQSDRILRDSSEEDIQLYFGRKKEICCIHIEEQPFYVVVYATDFLFSTPKRSWVS